jgi:hypothetical protein
MTLASNSTTAVAVENEVVERMPRDGLKCSVTETE